MSPRSPRKIHVRCRAQEQRQGQKPARDVVVDGQDDGKASFLDGQNYLDGDACAHVAVWRETQTERERKREQE